MIVSNLKNLMIERNITLNELSQRVGISYVNLSRIRTGKVVAVRFSTLNQLCKVLDCEVGDLFTYEEDIELPSDDEEEYYQDYEPVPEYNAYHHHPYEPT